MIKIKDYTEPEEFEDPNQNPLLPQHPFRLLIVGPSGCGKTNLLLNMIYDHLNFDALYVCAKDILEPKYQKLQENFTQFDDIEEEDIKSIKSKKKTQLLKLYKKFKKESLFCSHLDDMIDVDSLDPNQKNLIVFDDCITEKDQNKIVDLFIRGRKKNASIIYLSQSYYSTPINIRRNCNYIIFFKIHKREITQIIREIDGSLNTEQFKQIYNKAMKKPYDFLMLDPKMRYRRNFQII